MIVYPKSAEENQYLKDWLVERIPDYRYGQYTMCVAVFRDSEIAAVIGWDNFRDIDIEVTIAADNPRWATPDCIRELLLYPFGQLGVNRITAMVKKSNKRSRRMVEGFGFKLEGKHRWAADNKETVFSYGLVKDVFIDKWARNVRRKETTRATPRARSRTDRADGRAIQPN